MPKALPKTLFVKRQKDGTTEYFMADEDLTGMVEMGEKAAIGVYRLEAVEAVEGMVKVHPRRKT